MPAELPRGTVTLLFTDIEGSTRMLQELGREAYVRALTEHRRLLREAFTGHGGVEVEMQGDSFHFAFPYARDAVAAAVAGQRALAEHAWESQPIKVRIGLHTGEPMQADGLYAGLDVHWAARVMSAGYGGQVLLSARTADLVHGELPEEITLTDLGEHRLKDLTVPQRLYQVGNSNFPPLKSLAPLTNLPIAASPLIGRERELAELTQLLLDGAKVVTITGTGGTGKTRLALQAAAEVAESFADGVHWVPLAPVNDALLVLPTIAHTLGIQDDLGRCLAEQRTLLLLDNFEHLLDAAALVSALLAGAPDVKVLITSRSPLQIDGEHELALDPLADGPATTLFVERSHSAGRRLSADAPVLDICRRLDNLPLAIELAAARSRLLGPEALLARLEHRLPFLVGGRRDAPERQRTLRATIDWSYGLLDEPAKRVLERLSVFAGSFSMTAAEHVGEADLDTLAALAEASLLKPVGDDRLLMLQTIREFARESLDRSGEETRIQHRHAEWYLARALEAESSMGGEAEAVWLDQLELDQANLRHALQAFADDDDAELTLRLASALHRYWVIRGSAKEGLSWLEQALAATPVVATRERCLALAAGEDLARALKDFRRASELAGQRLQYARELNDLSGAATALGVIAAEAQFEGDLARARSLLEEGLAAAQRAGDRHVTGFLLCELGFLAYEEGDLDQALAHFQKSGDLGRELGDDQAVAAAAFDSAAILIETGRSRDAATALEEALERSRRLGWGDGIATSLELAGILVAQAAPADAAQGATLFAAADALRDELGVAVDFAFAELYEDAQAAMRNTLGDARFNETWESGRLLSADEAIREVERKLTAL